MFFQWFVAPDNGKVGSLKRRMRSHLGRWEMKNYTPLWREARFEVKLLKTPHVQSTFGSWDVEKVHTVVARSTFHTFLGALLEVELSKECTPLWPQHILKLKYVKMIKMHKTHHARITFGSWDDEKVHGVVAKQFRCQECKNLTGSEHFLKLRCWKRARRCGAKHILKRKWTKHTTLVGLLDVPDSQQLQLQLQLPLHYATLHIPYVQLARCFAADFIQNSLV